MLRTLLLLALFSQAVAVADQTSSESEVVRGTVNVALGNKNGIVVLTDSMLSGARRASPGPSRKKAVQIRRTNGLRNGGVLLRSSLYNRA